MCFFKELKIKYICISWFFTTEISMTLRYKYKFLLLSDYYWLERMGDIKRWKSSDDYAVYWKGLSSYWTFYFKSTLFLQLYWISDFIGPIQSQKKVSGISFIIFKSNVLGFCCLFTADWFNFCFCRVFSCYKSNTNQNTSYGHKSKEKVCLLNVFLLLHQTCTADYMKD